MINKTTKKKFSRYLKGGYVSEVLAILEEKEVKSSLGKPYSKQYISQVFNGVKSNLDIENAIASVYKDRKEQQKMHADKLKSL